MNALSETRALIIVDYQNDFVQGALPVAGAKDVLPCLVKMLEETRWGLVVATQDWHPELHTSFTRGCDKDTKPRWPPHCIAGTPGAELYMEGLWSKYVNLVIRKGYRAYYEAYSAFNDSGDDRRGGLAELLKHKGIRDVYVCGLAFDICVAYTAFDAAFHGFGSFILQDLCRSVGSKEIMFPTNRIKIITSELLERI